MPAPASPGRTVATGAAWMSRVLRAALSRRYRNSPPARDWSAGGALAANHPLLLVGLGLPVNQNRVAGCERRPRHIGDGGEGRAWADLIGSSGGGAAGQSRPSKEARSHVLNSDRAAPSVRRRVPPFSAGAVKEQLRGKVEPSGPRPKFFALRSATGLYRQYGQSLRRFSRRTAAW